jgi:hypothetical protein
MDGGSDVSAVTALIYPFFCCGEEGLGGKGGLEGREDGAESGDKAMQGCENEWGARYRMTGIQDVALKAKQRKGAEASSGSKAQPPAAPLSMYGGPESNVPPPSLPPSLPPSRPPRPPLVPLQPSGTRSRTAFPFPSFRSPPTSLPSACAGSRAWGKRTSPAVWGGELSSLLLSPVPPPQSRPSSSVQGLASIFL